MATYTESDLSFSFPPEWTVRRYDATVAYQSLSGHGLKGVDFLCLAPGDQLWLVEVKNYRSRGHAYPALRRSPRELATHVGRKFTDTKRLIRIVDRALRRRWWVRAQLAWYRYRGRARPESNFWFWSEAHRRLADPEKLVCLLWLETPERAADYDVAVTRSLEGLLEPGNRLLVAESRRPGPVPIRVTVPAS